MRGVLVTVCYAAFVLFYSFKVSAQQPNETTTEPTTTTLPPSPSPSPSPSASSPPSNSTQSSNTSRIGGVCEVPAVVPAEIEHRDDPQYDLVQTMYIESTEMNKTTQSDYPVCHREPILRYTFGSPVRPSESYAIPTEWSEFLSLAKTMIPEPFYELLFDRSAIWPEIILPFLFPLMSIALAAVTIIPLLTLGAVCWRILFNLRFLGHKKIRMLIRSFLIKMEKMRRNRYARSFPLQHLRKFRERDRYQMPKAFQNSDLSSDDEPEELKREEIPRERTSMWSDAQIELYGFDPDNIPLDLVYGDLLGDASKLAPEVKDYVNRKRRKKSKEEEENFDDASLNSDEWADFLRNKVTEKMQREKDLFLKTLQSRVQGGSKSNALGK